MERYTERKLSRIKFMVVGPYVQTLACVRRWRGVYDIFIGKKLHAQLRFSKTRLGSTGMFSSEPPEPLTDKCLSHVFTRLTIYHHISIKESISIAIS